MRRILSTLILILCSTLVLCQCGREDEHSTVIRIGCFPNVTHVQGLVARNMWRHKVCNGKGWFENEIPGYSEEWYTFNAGPTAMEALFGKTVDITYVGPSPALNAYAVSAGREVRLLAGAVNGGAALLVAKGSNINTPADFKGRSIATPQLGNTQDVSCRAWLIRNGLSCPLEGGGDCRVAPTPNAMQLQLMTQGEIDACWTVEPWVTRLEKNAGAQVLVEEPNVVTTVLASRVGWLKRHPQAAAHVIAAHEKLTQWIAQHPLQAQKHVADEMMHLTQSDEKERAEFEKLIKNAWARMTLTDTVDIAGLEQFVKDGQSTGLLDYVPPLQNMLYTPAPQPSTAAH
ncbi:MAG: ABC transporter substrate-binding protein [Akkermansia sp.]|nr:ABC transporter substrate-binding protein [Akkermansia sp.]